MFSGFSILSPSWLSVELPIVFIVVCALTVALSRGRVLRVRKVPEWRSASPGVAGPDRYDAFGYANVLRHVLGNILGASHVSEMVEPASPASDEEPDERSTACR